MKISLVSAGISTHSGLRVVVELAISLKEKGHNITIFAPKKDSSIETIRYLRQFDIKTKLFKEKSTIPQILELKNKLQKEAPDVISAHCTPSQLLAAWLTSIPIVWTYYGTQYDALIDHSFPNNPFWLSPLNFLTNKIIALRVKFMTLLADEIIAISHATSHEMKTKYNKTTAATIPFGSTPSTLKPESSKPNSKTLLSVSRITPYKGFHTIIEVVKDLKSIIPEMKLVIAGSSPQAKYLAYLHKISGPATTIRVNPSDNQLAKLYANASVYVTADKYLFYGLPIWEAASFSLPTIAMNYQAAPEAVIHGKTGFIANNKLQLQKYLQKLLQNPKLTRTLGKKAQKNAQLRSWNQCATNYEHLFRTIVNKSFQPLIPKLMRELFQKQRPEKNLALADLGTDTGINLLLLDKFGFLDNFDEVYAVDKNTPQLDNELTKKHPSINTVTADIASIKTIPTNSIDIVLLTQVIEHIDEQQKALKEIKRILKPQGKLFISSVAKKRYGLYWHKNLKGEITAHPDHTHEFQSLNELKNLITSSGLKILTAEQIPRRLQLFDYAVRFTNLFRGKSSSDEHRDLYFAKPRYIKWHTNLTLPLPGYSIIEIVAQKK